MPLITHAKNTAIVKSLIFIKFPPKKIDSVVYIIISQVLIGEKNMLSYKNYTLLNESLGQTIALGVRQTPIIGIVGAHDVENTLEEARKKCCAKKKMEDDAEEPEPEEDEIKVKSKSKDEPEEDEEGDVEDKIDKKIKSKDEPEDDEDEDKEDDDEETDEPKEPEDKPTLFQKKKQKKNMKKEDIEFFQSLSRQLGASTINQKFFDGIN
jgi:hypothetical protein